MLSPLSSRSPSRSLVLIQVLRTANMASAATADAEVSADGQGWSSFWNKPTRLRLALVRHGESMNNVHEAISQASYLQNRHHDPDLSKRGFRQAQLLGEYLADETRSQPLLGVHPVAELWVSPVKRTLQTMAPTAAALGLKPRVNTKLFEAGGIFESIAREAAAGAAAGAATQDTSYGETRALPGLTRPEMAELFPTYTLPPEVTEQGWHFRPGNATNGRESTEECRARAKGVARDFKAVAASLEADKNVICVVHYDFISALLDELVIPERVHDGPFINWHHFNTAVTVVDISKDGAVSLSAMNSVGHLTAGAASVSGVDDSAGLISGFAL